MKRTREYEIEPLSQAQTFPWRLVIRIDEAQGRTFFDFHWGNKATPTHTFVTTAEDWKEICRE